MLLHKLRRQEQGFTLIEAVIVIALTGVTVTVFATFFNTSISRYLSLDKDSLAFSDLATQAERIGNVVRGLTDISAADNNDITIYGYFAPDDTYVSLVHYYLANNNTEVRADVTPMTSNPPIGTPITNQKKTFTIIDSFYKVSNLNTFEYFDSLNNTLTPPIADLHTIKNIRINLAIPSKSPVANSDTTITVTMSLRNRKTNL